MSEYKVLARRYRPKTFSEVVGQDAIVQTLSNAIKNSRLAHAYLFTGTRGTGKTSVARIFAKCLNCQEGLSINPCLKCESCIRTADGDDPDVVEIDGASNRGIDEIRNIRENVQLQGMRSRFKIYIIDEVHMLTTQAFNALLKTLEEPPSHVKFIFATTDAQKVPITILSRCQRYDFVNVDKNRLSESLQKVVANEGYTIDEKSVAYLVKRARGSLRDAQSLLDQVIAFKPTNNVDIQWTDLVGVFASPTEDNSFSILDALFTGNLVRAFNLVAEYVDKGLMISELVDLLIDRWRDLLISKSQPSSDLLVSSENHDLLLKWSTLLSSDKIIQGMDFLIDTKQKLKLFSFDRVLVELLLAKLSGLMPKPEVVPEQRIIIEPPKVLPKDPVVNEICRIFNASLISLEPEN